MPPYSLLRVIVRKRRLRKRYPFTGRIVSIDPQEQVAVIDGDTIPGFMDAMAMSYKVKPPENPERTLPRRFHFCRSGQRTGGQRKWPLRLLARECQRYSPSENSTTRACDRSPHARPRRKCPRLFIHRSGWQAHFIQAISRESSARHFYLHALPVPGFLPAREQQLPRKSINTWGRTRRWPARSC